MALVFLAFSSIRGAAGLTGKSTGAFDLLLSRGGGGDRTPDHERAAVVDRDPRVDDLSKRVANTERLVRWLVRQEIRRQAREGGAVSDPPEDSQ